MPRILICRLPLGAWLWRVAIPGAWVVVFGTALSRARQRRDGSPERDRS